MIEKTVIIGGVAGGATAAARLRRRNEEMQIVLVERGDNISYANCGLPYYIGDVIPNRGALLLQSPEQMKKKYNVDVRIKNEVIKIIPDEKTVRIKDLNSGEIYEESYDHLVIATGSSPLVPPLPGIDAENIFTLWTVADTDRIKEYIENHNVKKAAVIGGGFIGLEMAENLHQRGISVSVIEMADQVMAPLDKEMANLVHEDLVKNEVDLFLSDGVKSFSAESDGTLIRLNSGREMKADLILLAIGIKPNSELASDAGIKLNERKGIVVNDYLETSIPDIYAVGDVIAVENYISKKPAMIPLAGPANKQARILADNLCGAYRRYKGSMGTAIARVFDLSVASVGLNEKQLNQAGKVKHEDYETVLINQKSHAGYYPGSSMMTLKLIFDRDGAIFGAQIVGKDGVDKRIDTIASVMAMNGSVFDLAELELAYAPPYSSAKDPVNMLGFVAENLLSGLIRFVEWDEVDAMIASRSEKDDFIILDVTEEAERRVYAIESSVHIPLGQLRDRIDELDQDKLIIPYCAIGVRSYIASRILMQNGFEQVAALSGGITFYRSMHYADEI